MHDCISLLFFLTAQYYKFTIILKSLGDARARPSALSLTVCVSVGHHAIAVLQVTAIVSCTRHCLLLLLFFFALFHPWSPRPSCIPTSTPFRYLYCNNLFLVFSVWLPGNDGKTLKGINLFMLSVESLFIILKP